MTSLVSEFLINPVLRTARRFSHTVRDDVPATDNRGLGQSRHEATVQEIAERLEALDDSGARRDALERALTGGPIASSLVDSDGELDAEMEALEIGRRSGSLAATVPIRVVPVGLASYRSSWDQVDDDASDNPSFGIPNRFRTGSGSTTLGSANLNMGDAIMSPAEGHSRSSTQEFPIPRAHHRNSSLPADDGMGPLRQRIITIQQMSVPPDEKARLMHRLLTRSYTKAQMFHTKPQQPLPSPGSMISQDRPTTPESLTSFIWQMNGGSDGLPPSQQYTFHLSPDDLKRTYAPLAPPELDEDGDFCLGEVVEELGCKHYKRNVKLQCSSCDRWYTCRLCHDEAEDHILNRKETKNMLCMICGCAQRAGESCVECGERTAWYYCGVCKLWDNDPNKSIYHCNDCGICRKGRGLGKDFFHCKTCGVCMSMSVEKSHKCIERVSDCDCPICGEYMFSSPHPVVFMLCGHSIHKRCYEEHMKTSYKCPICSKSTVNMETQFRNLDRAIDGQPMPPQFQDTKAMVSCNDCYAKSAVKYHWLGLKCAICDSYNTAQLSILSDPAVEVPVLESRESNTASTSEQANRDMISSGSLGIGPSRSRRHSSHIQPSSASSEGSNSISPYPIRQRTGRSVSPIRGRSLYDEPSPVVTNETESAEEDDLDFWGRDESRSVALILKAEEEEEEGSDDDSLSDDCDEDGDDDEEDEFELLGHR